MLFYDNENDRYINLLNIRTINIDKEYNQLIFDDEKSNTIIISYDNYEKLLIDFNKIKNVMEILQEVKYYD